MTSPGDRDEFVVLQKAYDLVVDVISRVSEFPSSFEFKVGDCRVNAEKIKCVKP